MSKIEYAWWEDPNEEDRAHRMVQLVKSLRSQELGTYRSQTKLYQQLYTGSPDITGTDSTMQGAQVRYNLVKAACDTAAAIGTAARTLPYFDSRGGDFRLRRQCQKANRTIQTQFAECDVWPEAAKAILDAIVSGLGVLKVIDSDPEIPGGGISVERQLPLSIVFDPSQCAHGKPTDLWQVALVDRSYLEALYPQHSKAIRDADGPSSEDREDFAIQLGQSQHQVQLVALYEGWHLSQNAEEPGVHILAIDGALLHCGEWKDQSFPFAFLHGWQPNLMGFCGQSITQHIRTAQERIDQLIERVTSIQNLASNAYLILPNSENGGGVAVEQLDNEPFKILRLGTSTLAGQQSPELQNFSGTPVDLQQEIDRIQNQAFQALGISPMQIQGERPAGVTSSVGMKTLEDIQSKRHIQNLRCIEAFYLDVAKALIQANRRLANDHPDFKLNQVTRRNLIEEVKWTDIDPKDQAKVGVLPVSQLSGSVSAQQDVISQWSEAGWVDPQAARSLVSMPDYEGYQEDTSIDVTYMMYLIEDIEDGKRVTPDPVLSLDQAIPVIRTQYLRAVSQQAEVSVLNEYRRVMGILQQRQQAIVAAQQAMQAPAASPPVQQQPAQPGQPAPN